MKPREFNPRKTLLVALVLIGLFVYSNVRKTPGPANPIFRGATMGTTYEVKIVGSTLSPRVLRALQTEINSRLKELNRQMSTYILDSEINQFNRSPANQPFTPSPAFLEVTRIALECSKLTQGAFDPTLGPLINLLGFGENGAITNAPSESEIVTAKKRCGYQHLALTNNQLVKTISGLELNLGAVAKGYAVDEISRLLTAQALTNHYVEIGGEIFVSGTSISNRLWRIGIQKPDGETGELTSHILELSGKAVATSGNYRNFFRDESGRLRSHLIDPQTGHPTLHSTISVTIVADTCVWADALATALFVMEPKKGVEVMESNQLYEALIIESSSAQTLTTIHSSGFEALLK